MACSSVTIQITPDSQPAVPSWMGEVAAFAQGLKHTGLLKTIQEEVRFSSEAEQELPSLQEVSQGLTGYAKATLIFVVALQRGYFLLSRQGRQMSAPVEFRAD